MTADRPAFPLAGPSAPPVWSLLAAPQRVHLLRVIAVLAGLVIPLLVIGRGGSDPDANSSISKITRLLWEGIGFGWAETAYTAVAAPLMAEALERTHRLGFKRLIVFPYLLFTGRLVEQVNATVEAYQSRHAEVQAVVAPYLNVHPLIVETFLERLAEAERGEARMNCQFCPYRTSIVGREDWRGAPQIGHDH